MTEQLATCTCTKPAHDMFVFGLLLLLGVLPKRTR